jgi:endonuclease/exonuclease/phosphatase family metal-dependent hydrolase
MTAGSTNNPIQTAKIGLKLGLLNAENLFLIFDHEVPLHYQKLTEAQWQKLSAAVYENKSLQKCMQIGRLIIENSPDIMMFCEVGGLESLNNFNRLFLNDLYHVALIEGNSDRNIDVGFLIKKDFPLYFDIVSNKQRPLNFLYPHETTSKKTGYPIKSETHFFSRDCAELRLFSQDKEKPFLILLLTHLKSRLDPGRIDPGGVERRSAELRTTIDIYKELKNRFKNTPLVFAGDMNGYAGKQNTDTEFLPLYLETDLEDVLEIANVSIDKRSTFYQIRNGGRSEGKQIDYCFVSKNLSDKVVKASAFVYRYKDDFGFSLDAPKSLDEKSRLASDHYPLFFNLENLEV